MTYTPPVHGSSNWDVTLNDALAAINNNAESRVGKGSLVVNVKDYGAKGDGVTDDTTAIQNAANAAAGGTLFIPAATFLHTGTINLSAGTRVAFAGRNAVLKYTGTTDAVAATTIKGLVIEGGGVIDVSGAGTNAVGLHFYGVWYATVNDLKVLQGPANSTGILIETGAAGSTAYYGSFCITLNNLDLFDGAGLYGIRTMKTAADPNAQDGVTHIQINNGWSKGKHTGLYLVNASTVFVNGFCVDTAYNGYYIEKSSSVVLKPGELGPVDNWAITFGTTAQEANGIVLLAPSYVGVSGATQRGYLDTSLIQPTVFDMSTSALRGSAGGEVGSELYYSVMQSLYSAAKSLTWRVRGGGAELEMLSWSDGGGLVINGGAGIQFANDLIVGSSGVQRIIRALNPDRTKKVDIFHDGTWAQHISDTGHVLQSNTSGTVAIGPASPGPQLKVQFQGGGYGSINLTHDDTKGTITTSAGDLLLSSSTATVRPTRLVETAVALTDGATISTDCSQGNVFTVTLGGNRTIASPASAVDGQVIRYRLKQDATGGRTVTWGPTFRFGTTYPQPTLSTAAGKNDYVRFVWNAADSRFDCLGYSLGL